jgi:HAD superfamily 5'-nucleotidase-like hydrolase
MFPHVYVNRILNLKKIKYLGLDMDHTLIRYHTQAFETLVYEYVIDELIQNKQYPSKIKESPFYFDEVIRGLVIDSQHGNILKLSRHGAIRESYHGTKLIDFAMQKQFYRSIYVDLNDPNYMVIDTAFSIAFCWLYSQLVDLRDEDPAAFPTYSVIALDVLASLDKVHAEGKLKRYISEHLETYIIKEPDVVAGLQRYIQYGKKIFILTNSNYTYTKQLLDFAINPFLKPGETWQDLFEFVITQADKPRFFYDKIRFLSVDATTGAMKNFTGRIEPGIYQGGNALQFTEDLHLKGDEILYVGDHIYGDILRLKKHCNWRTALVVDELGAEVEAQQKALPIEKKIIKAMLIKEELERESVEYHMRAIDETENLPAIQKTIQTLQKKIMKIDLDVAHLLKKQRSYFNPRWERVFRAGIEESFFAFQVERYACIYMEKLLDLVSSSPLTYFRPRKRLLPHDQA